MPSNYTQRLFAGGSDLDALVGFAAASTAARAPATARWHPGDIVWSLSSFDATQPTDRIELWCRQNTIVGVLIWESRTSMRFDCMPADENALVPSMLERACAVRDAQQRARPARTNTRDASTSSRSALSLSTQVRTGDSVRTAQLRLARFRPNGAAAVHLARSLRDAIDAPRLPPNMRFADASAPALNVEARIAVHRDAWSALGHIGLPTAQSQFDATQYQRLRASAAFDPTLDVLIEHAGRYVASALCWTDAASGIGLTEPVGTIPTHRGQGLSRAVNLEVLRRMRARGMHTAIIQTASFNLPAQATYLSCGYTQVDEDAHYILERDVDTN